ncbi:MAG: class I SAM-dependent methyltransferase [Rubripirellula sp.]
MRVLDTAKNVHKNEEHYDQTYGEVRIDSIVSTINNFDDFFADAVVTDTSWYGLYQQSFAEQLKGKRVLELGCGDGVNALSMAKLGANVVAVDISGQSARIVNEAAEQLQLQGQVQGLAGDFTELPFEDHSFDIIVGKAFLHHLTHELEREYLKKSASLLKQDGQARFFEPAENNRLLDAMRWMVPVKGRPSSLNKKAFKKWEENDPHPERENTSRAYLDCAREFFDDAQVFPLGSLERFHKLMPQGSFNRKYRRLAHRLDVHLPQSIRLSFARSQLLIYRAPIVSQLG